MKKLILRNCFNNILLWYVGKKCLINSLQNKELRIDMGKAVKKGYEEKCTLAHFENRMVEILEEVISEK